MPDSGISILFEGRNLIRLAQGLWVTAYIAFVSVALSTLLGVLVGLAMSSRFMALRAVMRLYLDAIRIVPVLVLLFLAYFGLGKVFHVNLNAELASILVFTLWGAAEMGDIVRGAVTSLPRHQRESGLSIGLTEGQVYRYVIIPQAVRRLLPGAINLATRMIKTTSLVMLIGVVEVLKVGQQIIEYASLISNPTASFWVYAFILFLYFAICYPISRYAAYLEQKWQS